MEIPIPSNNQSFNLKIGVRAHEPMDLAVWGADKSKNNTYYFKRKVPFGKNMFEQKGGAYREFTVPLPLSPELLTVDIFDKNYGDDVSFGIEKFELEKFQPSPFWADENVHRFIPFAEYFAQNSGHLPVGFHESKDGDFLISYLPVINDGLEGELITPARINRKSGRMQVSKRHFVKYTIPMRLYILLHEFFHKDIPTRNEIEADTHALKIYLDLGAPKTEAIYALTKVFKNHGVGRRHVRRVQNALRFINKYSAESSTKKEPAINEEQLHHRDSFRPYRDKSFQEK